MTSSSRRLPSLCHKKSTFFNSFCSCGFNLRIDIVQMKQESVGVWLLETGRGRGRSEGSIKVVGGQRYSKSEVHEVQSSIWLAHPQQDFSLFFVFLVPLRVSTISMLSHRWRFKETTHPSSHPPRPPRDSFISGLSNKPSFVGLCGLQLLLSTETDNEF